jgi:spermidine/putrescine transport system permease protein
MVFIPSVSTFIISKMLGGGSELMIGDLIEMQFVGGAYNPHLGSAIALIMMLIVEKAKNIEILCNLNLV